MNTRMTSPTHETWQNITRILVCVVILKVVVEVVAGYRSYFPPDFTTEFLYGRGEYFWNGYHVAFYVHVIAGPITLVLGLLLISRRLRTRFVRAHRRLGQFQVGLVMVLLVPSGLWMSFFAGPGLVTQIAFATLAVCTGICAAQGWRSARRNRYSDHARWMIRCFTLLVSAVVLRLIGGAFEVAQVDSVWTYSFAAWASWCAPLLCLEFAFLVRARKLTAEGTAVTERDWAVNRDHHPLRRLQ